MTRLTQFIHSYASEVTGFLTGGPVGIIAYMQWQDAIITVGLAFVTGFIGAAGAHLYRKLTKEK